MILPCVYLFQQATDSDPVLPHRYKDIFGIKTQCFIMIDYFNVRKPLTIRRHLVLALYN